MTAGNIPIAIVFTMIILSQFVLGTYTLILTAMEGGKANLSDQKNHSHSRDPPLCRGCSRVAQSFPPIPLDAYHMCVFTPHRARNLSYTSISLLYGALRPVCQPNSRYSPAENTHTSDFLAFSLIIFLARKWRVTGLGFPTLWDIIARDATLYFLVIFSSQLVLEITLIFGRVSATVASSKLPLLTPIIGLSRKRYNFSQLRKLSLTYYKYKYPHYAAWHPNQRHCRVSLAVMFTNSND